MFAPHWRSQKKKKKKLCGFIKNIQEEKICPLFMTDKTHSKQVKTVREFLSKS